MRQDEVEIDVLLLHYWFLPSVMTSALVEPDDALPLKWP